MYHAIRALVGLAALSLTATSVRAHYNMLLPERHSVKRGETVTLLHQWGHPFEHQLFDTAAPEKVYVLSPDGTTTDLTKKMDKVTLVTAGAKRVTAYRLHFTAEQRADKAFVLLWPPIWREEAELFFRE